MPYKYAAELNLIENCPPADAISCERESYRFVHENIADERNFKCICKLNSARKLKAHEQCSGFGLSMFVSKEKAIERYKQLAFSNKNIGKTLGARLAQGTIKPNDGLVSKPNGMGHFDLWEVDGADFVTSFQIVADLMS